MPMLVTDGQSDMDHKNLDRKDFTVRVSLENAGTCVEGVARSTGMRRRMKDVFGRTE